MKHAKLIYIKTKAAYDILCLEDEFKDSLNSSLVFIEDTGEIFTHAHSFGGNTGALANNLINNRNNEGILELKKVGDDYQILSTKYYALPTTKGSANQIWVSNGDETGSWLNFDNFVAQATITKESQNLTTEWTDIADLPNKEGVHLLKIKYQYTVTTQEKNEETDEFEDVDTVYKGIASGLFSINIESETITDFIGDEIPLHIHGNFDGNDRIYARTNGGKLQMAATKDITFNLNIQYKQLI